MRRNLTQNKFIVLIVIVAFFTIASYAFDQRIISDEDKIRNLRIKYENYKVELNSLNSLNSQLEEIHDGAASIINNYLTYRNINIKRYLLIPRYDLGRTENKSFLNDVDIAKYKVLDNLIRHYLDIVMDSDELDDKLTELYSWNSKYFSKYNKIENNEIIFDGFVSNYSDITKIFNKNIDSFNKKDSNFYIGKLFSLFMEGYNNTKISSFYNLSNIKDIHKFSILLIKNIDDNQTEILENIELINGEILKHEKLMAETMDKLKKASSTKNLYILSSIFSQIISLLFLLLLFRSLLLKKSK